jgi:diadenosine tetraphosphatase ApaH/serine/threonine PP2A family protein phosphatase
MPRYAILADVHANLEALTAVLKFLKPMSIDRILICGDLVGYNASPNKCVDLIRDLGATCILGNHDALMLKEDPTLEHYEDADRVIKWTRRHLSKEHLPFLRALPLTRTVGGVFMTHATPIEPESFYYVRDTPEPAGPEDEHSHYIEEIFAHMRQHSIRLCLCGHSHCPGVHCQYDGDGYSVTSAEFTGVTKQGRMLSLKAGLHGLPLAAAMINVGSVGQPRDGDPRACVTLYDSEGEVVNQFRVPYDVEAAQRKIIAAGLPRFMAERLSGFPAGG